MTKRTTDEWQTLLDGVAEVPWEARQDGHDPVWMIGRLGDNPARIVGDGYGEGNARLLAAAPEAVAEVVRLRRALEELRDCYRHREARSRERLESVTDEREQSHLARFAHYHRRTHEALTRILDGSADEWPAGVVEA